MCVEQKTSAGRRCYLNLELVGEGVRVRRLGGGVRLRRLVVVYDVGSVRDDQHSGFRLWYCSSDVYSSPSASDFLLQAAVLVVRLQAIQASLATDRVPAGARRL